MEWQTCLSQIFEVVAFSKGGVKGKELENARIGLSRSATPWLRLTPYGRTLRSPHFVGFANPIERKGETALARA